MVEEEEEIIEEELIDEVEEGATIQVMGMETTESFQNGRPWSRPSSPIAPPLHLVNKS